jgi:hypothetical protein
MRGLTRFCVPLQLRQGRSVDRPACHAALRFRLASLRPLNDRTDSRRACGAASADRPLGTCAELFHPLHSAKIHGPLHRQAGFRCTLYCLWFRPALRTTERRHERRLTQRPSRTEQRQFLSAPASTLNRRAIRILCRLNRLLLVRRVQRLVVHRPVERALVVHLLAVHLLVERVLVVRVLVVRVLLMRTLLGSSDPRDHRLRRSDCGRHRDHWDGPRFYRREYRGSGPHVC